MTERTHHQVDSYLVVVRLFASRYDIPVVLLDVLSPLSKIRLTVVVNLDLLYCILLVLSDELK